MENTNDISYVLRLLPGNDLRLSIENFVNENKIEAGWIVTCAGSLIAYTIRFANENNSSNGNGYFEIVSLTGTLSVNGCHLHISIADDKGKTIGGHLLHGCVIYTTAEIVVVKSGSYIFTREKDENADWNELHVKKK
jgi:uncharacterized protein